MFLLTRILPYKDSFCPFTGKWGSMKIRILAYFIQYFLSVGKVTMLCRHLSNIFYNDIFYFTQETYICNFADDNSLCSLENNFKEIESILRTLSGKKYSNESPALTKRMDNWVVGASN